MTRPAVLAAALLAAVATLPGCAKKVTPPFDEGVCYVVNFDKTGTPSYKKLASGVATLESCEAGLEALRIRFLGLGGSHTELTGSYQGRFIFVQLEGLFTAEDLDAPRYLSLVRLPNGHLGPPGAAGAAAQ